MYDVLICKDEEEVYLFTEDGFSVPNVERNQSNSVTCFHLPMICKWNINISLSWDQTSICMVFTFFKVNESIEDIDVLLRFNDNQMLSKTDFMGEVSFQINDVPDAVNQCHVVLPNHKVEFVMKLSNLSSDDFLKLNLIYAENEQFLQIPELNLLEAFNGTIEGLASVLYEKVILSEEIEFSTERKKGVNPKKLKKALIKIGFEIARVKGSHFQMVKGNNRITVPMHSKDMPYGTLMSILKSAGLTKEFLSVV